jgi:hypothetical protein
MPCQPYKDALVQTAASGAEPVVELRAHLASCPECRSAFELERSLFASIDSGLRLTANAEVPASLLPRIRARLDETPAPVRFWSANWIVLASAAALLLASFTAYSLWHTRPKNLSPNSAQTNSPSAPVRPSQPSPAPSSVSHEKQLVSPPPNRPVASAPVRQPRAEPAVATLEILVPPNDELLLTNYAQQWRQRKQLLLVAEAANETDFPLLQVSPIQITELDVKPLAEGKSQGSPLPQTNFTTAPAVQEEME